ncbi:GNAT family N-acetyltransferase [Vibrio fluvialis]|jgi:ribosomal protein S18 acetylase RimI-like enzyme|uniref:GNAT family N-acetyltransferase n=1 Tax=Vibrio fluvialis TaxID=676 RepID=UPI001C9CB546|nr:GNAT family N-acetyltransferase [Vibrio fluvialis]
MDFSLRQATPNDMEFLLTLRDVTMRHYLEQVGAPTSREAFLQRIHYHFDDAKIVLIDDQLAGLFKATFLPDRNQWYLVQIQVHPDFQNARIGSRLIAALIEQAKTEGASVGLSVLKSNPAQHLYARLGFQCTGESEFEYDMVCPA